MKAKLTNMPKYVGGHYKPLCEYGHGFLLDGVCTLRTMKEVLSVIKENKAEYIILATTGELVWDVQAGWLNGWAKKGKEVAYHG